MKNSELHRCGYSGEKDENIGLFIHTNDILIEDNLVSNNYYGVLFYKSHNNIIKDNTIQDNYCGVLFLNSTDTTITLKFHLVSFC